MNHTMKLQPGPYAKIRSGRKTIELRLNDEKRQCICIGDTIAFTSTENPDSALITEVTGLHRYSSFADLFAALPLEQCGMEAAGSVDAAVLEMRSYYPEEKERRYGVLGIGIHLLGEEERSIQ